MSKNREAVTCNGRPAFYASMYEDIRKCAMDSGWTVALHGSLASDMDILAMPWTNDAVLFTKLICNISKLFDGNSMSELYSISYNEKPHGRIVATIPIWEDFYLDISTIEAVPVVHGEWIRNENPIETSCECSICHAKDYWYDIDKANEYYWFHRNFCPNCGARMKGGTE